MPWKPLKLPKAPDQIAGKEFKQYTASDWRSYNEWSAEFLRMCAEQSEEAGRPEQADREPAAADKHEEWSKER